MDNLINGIYPKNFYGYKFEKKPKAYIKHFFTKTAEEFCGKISRGNAHFHKNHSKYNAIIKGKINLFFKLNKVTDKKIDILERCTGMKLKKEFINKL
jgi:hypothetical protein